MGAGHDQGVAIEDGPVVEEGDDGVLLQHHVGRKGAFNELIEQAV